MEDSEQSIRAKLEILKRKVEIKRTEGPSAGGDEEAARRARTDFMLDIAHAQEYARNKRIHAFLLESNKIEGIDGSSDTEYDEFREFIELPRDKLTVEAIERLAHVFTDGEGLLRCVEGMDVRVGTHVPQSGGPGIRKNLEILLHSIRAGALDPYAAHQGYEALHPFMDGNGRTGRALWAWHMLDTGRDPFALGFLHTWYYQSLANEQ